MLIEAEKTLLPWNEEQDFMKVGDKITLDAIKNGTVTAIGWSPTFEDFFFSAIIIIPKHVILIMRIIRGDNKHGYFSQEILKKA